MAQQAPKESAAGSQQQGERPKILRIGIVLGGKIVEERLVRKRENVTIGQSAKNTFSIPSPELPRSWTLFQLVNNAYVLNVADGMDGRVSDGGKVLALAQLRAAGKSQKQGAGWQTPLSDSARGKIILGDMTLLFQFVQVPPLQPRPQLPHSVRGTLADRIDPYMAVVLACSFVLHGGVGIYIWNLDLPAPPAADEIPDRFAKGLMEKPKVLEPPKKQGKEGAAGAEAKADKKDDKSKKSDEAKDSAAKSDKKSEDKATSAAPPPPDKAAVAAAVQNSAVIQILGRVSSGGAGRFVDVTGGKDVGGDLDKGLANVGKSGTGIALVGSNTLGAARGQATGEIGTGKVTGVSGPTGPASTGGGKVEEAIKVDVKTEKIDAIESGGLDPDKVMGTIKGRYFRSVSDCYQAGLKKDPKMGGKVTIAFTIGPLGNVTKVHAEGFDDGVNSCIESRARGWRFDKPDEGSAEFEIPFVLKPGS